MAATVMTTEAQSLMTQIKDPVLLLAFIIDNIQRGRVRVRNFDLFTHPMRPDDMELVYRLEGSREYNAELSLRGPTTNLDDDIGDSIGGEVNVTTVGFRDILKEIQEFRQWRENEWRYRGATAGPPPVAVPEMWRKAGMSPEQYAAIRDEIERDSTPVAKPRPRFDDAPDFPGDYNPDNMPGVDPRKLAAYEKRARNKAREAAKPVESETPKPAGARDLIFDD